MAIDNNLGAPEKRNSRKQNWSPTLNTYSQSCKSCRITSKALAKAWDVKGYRLTAKRDIPHRSNVNQLQQQHAP